MRALALLGLLVTATVVDGGFLMGQSLSRSEDSTPRSLIPVIPLASGLRMDAQASWSVQVADSGQSMGPLSLQLDDFSPEAPTWRHRVLTALGGAVLGAGIGFFASQVARGDWDEGPRQGTINRPAWAAVGGSLGFAAGFSFPLTEFGVPGGGSGRSPSGRQVILAEEIHEAVITNALEAVRTLRPEWLVQRGQESFNDPTSDAIRFYMDGVPIGAIESLRSVSADMIVEIRFFDATRATARFGTGHTHGAIEVITVR